MELDLHKNYFNYYDRVVDTTLCQEETMEAIVPDAYPDILELVDCQATAQLKTKELQEGRLLLSGTIQAALLYLPEGGAGLESLKLQLPFTCALEASELHSHCIPVVRPRIRSADARSLNPRKVLARADLMVEVQVYGRQTAQICDHVTEHPDQGMQQQIGTEQAYLVVAVEEKPFSFTEDVALSGSRPPMEQLLHVRAVPLCHESKLIGSKLIFKGEVHLQLLYRDLGQSVSMAQFNLPFSQIVEVTEAGEQSGCDLMLQMTDCSCVQAHQGGETGTVSVAVSLLAQVVVRESRQVALLTDVYSTLHPLRPEYKSLSLPKRREEASRQLNVRELVDCSGGVRDVLDIYVNLGEVRPLGQGQTGFEADTLVTLLYRGEEGKLSTVKQTIPVSCPLDLYQVDELGCQVSCGTEWFATPSGSGIEVRYSLTFRYLALQKGKTQVVSALYLEESEGEEPLPQASIVLRMVGEEEGLWDIAKAYRTTMEDILQANAIEGEQLPKGQLVLIPKKR